MYFSPCIEAKRMSSKMNVKKSVNLGFFFVLLCRYLGFVESGVR